MACDSSVGGGDGQGLCSHGADIPGAVRAIRGFCQSIMKMKGTC